MLLKPLKHHTWSRESSDLFSLDFPLPDFGFPFASCVIEPQPPEVALTDAQLDKMDKICKVQEELKALLELAAALMKQFYDV
ncbi:hypothetical protein H2248_011319 [Termitomyces sp. 'cryptogamus']|nr:hypothetical protein H2248_011319 [Termitomyces sp. 'cryptogamus']